jgi:hypothetical protein
MITYAKIDSNNKVVDVIVLDLVYVDELEGQKFININCGIEGTWLKSSNERKNSAGIGMTYDFERNAFLHNQPYPSWTINEETCIWEAPKPRPKGLGYVWNEESLDWVEVSFN